jgi:hypothetical protein
MDNDGLCEAQLRRARLCDTGGDGGHYVIFVHIVARENSC